MARRGIGRAAALVVTAACADGGAEADADAPAVGPPPTTVQARTVDGSTELTLRGPAGAPSVALRVSRDSTVAPDAPPERVELVGRATAALAIVTDTYASAPLGLSRCQAGEERFVRAIALAADGARETYRAKLGSCRDDVEPDEPAVEWVPDSATLRVRWLAARKTGAASVHAIRFGPDGRVAEQRALPEP